MTSSPQPRFEEYGIRVVRETAGTGGIQVIRGELLPRNRKRVTISGVLLPSIPRANAPNYNRRLPSGSMVGLSGYEIAHLWGPGFGDEAWAGMMYAPREVNQDWQNRGVEGWLRNLRYASDRAGGGGQVKVVAAATSHPLGTWRGHDVLQSVTYNAYLLQSGGSEQWIARVELEVGPPGQAEVDVDVSGVAF